jgi:hypothetical protein
MVQIAAPIQRMVDATNSANSDAFVAAFTPDAFLEDWGRQFHGHEGVARWNQSDNIGKRAHFEATAERRDGDDYVVTLVVTGGGFNGTSDFTFTIDGDLISRMVISAD